MIALDDAKAWLLRSSWPRYLVYFASIAAIVGAALEVTVLYWVAGIAAAAATLWSAEQNAESGRLLQRQGERIVELSTRNAALLTGGDSFCYFEVSNLRQAQDVEMSVVIHVGEAPLYGVEARIVDLQQFDALPRPLTLDAFEGEVRLSIAEMAPGSAITLRGQPFVLGDADERDFNIFFAARNGFFTQSLRFRRVNGRWTRTTEVVRGNEVIFERGVDDPPPE